MITRQEQLSFCKQCIHQKLDGSQEIICGLTGKSPDFQVACETFEQDKTIFEEPSEAILIALRSHQRFGFALLGGGLIAILASLLWAAVTVITKIQIGFMAIGVGLLVGLGVRFFGAGVDKHFGFLGALLAFMGCLIGNLLSQVAFYAHQEGLDYFEVLGYVNAGNFWEITTEGFLPIDLLFYILAIGQGYKFAIRPVPDDLSETTPAGEVYRFPLAITAAVLIGFALFAAQSAGSGEKTHYYESGEVMSKGELSRGLADGNWQYFYEDGALAAEGLYEKGKETGEWKFYSPEGDLIRIETYTRGLLHGTYLTFHGEGVLMDSGRYEAGRMMGPWISYYENGKISQKGDYNVDLPDGEWVYYHENGNLFLRGAYETGERSGIWFTWDENGKLKNELTYLSNDLFGFVNYWDDKNKQLIENGQGKYVSRYDNGKIASEGWVKDQWMEGPWITYHENGKKSMELVYKQGKAKVVNAWDEKAGQMVKNGEGTYIDLYDDDRIYEQGQYKNGLKNGNWKTYYDDDPQTLSSQINYFQGKLDGYYIIYQSEGKELIRGYHESDQRVGSWTWFYPEGEVESEVKYVDGKKEGVQLFYDEGGKVVKTEHYANGKLLKTDW